MGPVWDIFQVKVASLSNRTLDSEKHYRKTHGFREKNRAQIMQTCSPNINRNPHDGRPMPRE